VNYLILNGSKYRKLVLFIYRCPRRAAAYGQQAGTPARSPQIKPNRFRLSSAKKFNQGWPNTRITTNNYHYAFRHSGLINHD